MTAERGGTAGRLALLATVLVLALLGLMAALLPTSGTRAQAPATPTATPDPRPTLPALGGRWSVTRSWHRRCPACAMPIVRTTTWRITVVSDSLRVQGGPRGTLIADGAGGALVSLEGLERVADSTLRFAYGTLRVGSDGRVMEGGFNGSERLANPCASSPPVVTCFASGGWLRAVRLADAPAPTGSPTPTGPPRATPPATAAAAPSPTGTSAPSPTSAPTATETLPPPATPNPSPTAGSPSSPTPAPSASATAAPPDRGWAWLPLLAPEPR